MLLLDVTEAHVNLLAGQAVVKLRPGSIIGPRDVMEAVEDAGFEVELWQEDTGDDASAQLHM